MTLTSFGEEETYLSQTFGASVSRTGLSGNVEDQPPRGEENDHYSHADFLAVVNAALPGFELIEAKAPGALWGVTLTLRDLMVLRNS